jgi:hypothetical protein
MDLQDVGGGCGDWMELAQYRDRWRAFVSRVSKLAFLKPNFRNLAFFKFGWRHKIYYAYWLFSGVFTC